MSVHSSMCTSMHMSIYMRVHMPARMHARRPTHISHTGLRTRPHSGALLSLSGARPHAAAPSCPHAAGPLFSPFQCLRSMPTASADGLSRAAGTWRSVLAQILPTPPPPVRSGPSAFAVGMRRSLAKKNRSGWRTVSATIARTIAA